MRQSYQKRELDHQCTRQHIWLQPKNRCTLYWTWCLSRSLPNFIPQDLLLHLPIANTGHPRLNFGFTYLFQFSCLCWNHYILRLRLLNSFFRERTNRECCIEIWRGKVLGRALTTKTSPPWGCRKCWAWCFAPHKYLCRGTSSLSKHRSRNLAPGWHFSACLYLCFFRAS